MQGEAYKEFSNVVEKNREALRKMVSELHGQSEFMTGKCPLQHCGMARCFRHTEENSLTAADMKQVVTRNTAFILWRRAFLSVRGVRFIRRELTDISEGGTLHFLEYGGNNPGEQARSVLKEVKQLVLQYGEPRVVYHVFELHDAQPVDSGAQFVGSNIQRLLKESHACVSMAATLGSRIDKEMKKLQAQDMVKAVLFDSCASAAIGAVCDNLQKELQKSYPCLTSHYSCNYGDLPITLQASFLQALDVQRRIRFHVSESSPLVPMKSVTAIIGIADRIQPAVLRGCGRCQLVKQCAYRKRGKFCGN